MPKKKIKKAVSKRFKITKTGKVMHARQMSKHLLRRKSARRKRRLAEPHALEGKFGKKVKQMLGTL